MIDLFGKTDLLTMPSNVPGTGRGAEEVARSSGARLLGGPVRERPRRPDSVRP